VHDDLPMSPSGQKLTTDWLAGTFVRAMPISR
jgi:hypothetical protein